MEYTDKDLISVIIAVFAVIIATVEVLIKYYGNVSEKKTLLYTKYLYICQRVEIGVLAVGKLLKMIREERISKKEIRGFAKAHLISDDVIKCIHEYQELAFICLKSKDNSEVLKALEFCGIAKTSVESVNAFFQSIIMNEQEILNEKGLVADLQSQRVKDMYMEMNIYLRKLKDVEDDSTHELLSSVKNLRTIMYNIVKDQSRMGKYVRIVYIFVCISLIVLCIIYIIYLHFELINATFPLIKLVQLIDL
ncbi:MAG: hypothetical protein IJE43_05865 [Alphaproteobacteria bacterium]|nr:hypothetical protein [Alphaproteobacteria bacterium]